MRHIFIAVALAASAFTASGCASTGARGALIERTDVMEGARRVAERYASAWNANDMSGFGALFTADARYVNLQGAFLRGRSAIVAAHRETRARYAAGVRMATRLEGARAITNDAVIAVMVMEIVNDPARAGDVQASRLTLTLVRQGDAWLIAQAHASAM
jgi:uncharacterized protein (TIGR02246 family)